MLLLLVAAALKRVALRVLGETTTKALASDGSVLALLAKLALLRSLLLTLTLAICCTSLELLYSKSWACWTYVLSKPSELGAQIGQVQAVHVA